MNLDQILASIRDNYADPDIHFLVEKMAGGDLSVRKQLADKISILPAAVSPLLLLEISRWGITDEMSACKEIRSVS